MVLAVGCDARALEPIDLGDARQSDAAAPTDGAQGNGADGSADLTTAAHLLSGTVTDACTRRGTTARVGIAGRRQCSVDGKGSYYFDDLPGGKLALVAFKEGYRLFEVAVSITAQGTIQDIVLHPDTPGDCADPPPADIACVCSLPGCL
ncbi:MAG TPA: hypothetical protein VNO55_07730 [Polyangia bacterium]|nr:hypothetical protein [Polyangia bacterium]